jgi:Subtilisin inhibitor-like
MPTPRHRVPAREGIRTGAAVLAVSLLVLGGCGGGDGSVTTEPSPPPSTVTAPPSTAIPTPGTGSTTSTTGSTRLTVALDETGEGRARTFDLTCEPPGGNHPNPAAACEALRAAGGAGAFQSPRKDVACTEVYGGPETATVTGTVDGATVTMTFSRTDGCQISRWRQLAPLLGTPGAAQP